MKVMNKEVSNKITKITFCSNIMIFLSHTNLSNYLGITQGFSYEVMRLFSITAIPIMSWFFFITAYLFFRNLTSVNEIFLKWKKRIYSLLIPYILWNTIGQVVHMLGPDEEHFTGIIDFIRNTYIFCDGYGCGTVPLWYIFRILEFMLLAPLIYCIIRKMSKSIAVLVVLCLVLVNITCGIKYFDFSFFLPVYFIGAYMGLNDSESIESFLEKNNGKKYEKIVWIVIFILVVYMMCTTGITWITYNCMSAFFVIIVARNIFDGKAPTLFVKSAGMYIFCAHDIICRFVRALVLKINIEVPIVSWGIYVLGVWLILVFSWYILYKFFPKLLNVLSGGRVA